MTAPTPQAGANNWTGAYQIKQFDQGLAGDPPHGYGNNTVLGALANPDPAAVIASESPDVVFDENTNPVNQNSSYLGYNQGSY